MQALSSDHKKGPRAEVGRRLDAQRVRISAYATALGYELVTVEEDHLSGRLGPNRREGLARALAAVRDKEADGLVVFKLDRLSRKTMDVLELADDARRGRWRLLSVCEHLDTSTAAGQFVLTMFAALAEMERRQIGERTALGMAQVARQGRARSYVLPFGYRVMERRSVVDSCAFPTPHWQQNRWVGIRRAVGWCARQSRCSRAPQCDSCRSRWCAAAGCGLPLGRPGKEAARDA